MYLLIVKNTRFFHNTMMRVLLLAVLIFNISVASALTGRSVFIDSVEIKKDIDKASTTLHLRIPIRYLGHFPGSEGRVLKIRFQAILRGSLANMTNESVSPPINECPVIRDISLDRGMGDDYYLTYHFKHSVHYQVVRQTNPQQLVVILSNPNIDEAGDPCDAR